MSAKRPKPAALGKEATASRALKPSDACGEAVRGAADERDPEYPGQAGAATLRLPRRMESPQAKERPMPSSPHPAGPR